MELENLGGKEAHQGVLGVGDPGEHGAGGPPVRIDGGLLHGHLHRPEGVVAVVDGEVPVARREAGLVAGPDVGVVDARGTASGPDHVGLSFQLAERNRVPTGQMVIRWKGSNHRSRKKRLDVEPSLVEGTKEKPHVGAFLAKSRELLRRGLLHEVELALRTLGPKRLDNRRESASHRGRLVANREKASQSVPRCSRHRLRPLGLPEDARRVGEKRPARLRQGNPPGRAVEKTDADLVLEGLNLLTQGRLGDEDRVRRPAEVHLF